MGVDIDDAANGIATVECALRTAVHFNGGDVAHVDVEGRCLEVGHPVYIEPHGRTLGFGTHTTNEHGCVLARTIVGHVEVGEHGRELFQALHLLVAQHLNVGYRYRRGSALGGILLEVANHHLFKFHLLADARIGALCDGVDGECHAKQ